MHRIPDNLRPPRLSPLSSHCSLSRGQPLFRQAIPNRGRVKRSMSGHRAACTYTLAMCAFCYVRITFSSILRRTNVFQNIAVSLAARVLTSGCPHICPLL
jgi:hypothetical protein